MKTVNNRFFNSRLLGLSLFILSACSGSGGDGAKVSSRDLALTVSGSHSFNSDIVHGQISYYQMTLTAVDLADPFVARFDGNADSAQMLGVPVGTDRTIVMEAVNPNGLVIRRGKKEGVTIAGGQTTSVEIVMNSVPIFTNITNQSAVAGNRIQFEIFGEPDSKLKVVEKNSDGEASETQAAMSDATTDSAWVNTSDQEGIFSVDPSSSFSYGVHTFEVSDEETGESSAVQVSLYQPTTRPGIVFNSGGKVSWQGSDMVLVSTGQPYFHAVNASNGNLGNDTFLDIVPMIY